MIDSSPVDWVLVADRMRASLYRVSPKDAQPWTALASFVHVDSQALGVNHNGGPPGRVIHPGGARSAVEPHEDRAHVEARRFAVNLIEYLDRERHLGKFQRLTVVAPPMFLGVLRDASPSPLRIITALEVNQDLVSLPETDLRLRLGEILSALPS